MPERPPTYDPDATDHDPSRPSDGRRIGEFEILRELGRGSMGVVYEAHQSSLDRRVALKVLPPALGQDRRATQRFEREARAAARLRHPNIVTVHAIGGLGPSTSSPSTSSGQAGQPFYVMDLVDGVSLDRILEDLSQGRWNHSLDGTLSGEGASVDRAAIESQSRTGGRAWADTACSLIAEVAEALQYAHDQGVVHRDIRPANLMLSSQGHVRITDFGLARLAQEPGLTISGSLLVTPVYQSPEQVAPGRTPLDHRTDIYSLGAVLYEMLTLQRPFEGDSREVVTRAVLTRDPAPPRRVKRAIPRELEAICLKALEKDLDRRYPTAGEMARDLREYLRRGRVAARPIGPLRRTLRTARRHPTASTAAAALAVIAVLVALNLERVRQVLVPSAGPPIKRIAVLPFRNVSDDPEQALYADGITEVLIADLGQLRALEVIALRSVMQYKDTAKSIPEIAGELHVEAIVEGSVARSEERIEVAAALIDAATDNRLWDKRYERSQKDILVLQGEVARAIANQIRVEMTPEEQALLSVDRVVDPEAHEAYLIGKSFVQQWSPDAVHKGIGYLEQALQHDPEYAPAFAGLAQAHVYSAIPGGGWRPASEVADKARQAALRALELDDSLAEAHTMLGGVSMLFDWDVELAEREFRRAIELNPSFPEARTIYAGLLSHLGRHAEALEQLEIVIRIDPLYQWYRAWVARAHYMAGDYARAHEEYRQMLDLDPSPVWRALVNWARGETEIAEGRVEVAVTSMERAVELTGRMHAGMLASLGNAYGLAGRREDAAAVLHELSALAEQRYVSPYAFACLHSGTGDIDAAFEELERGYEQRCGYMYAVAASKCLEPLHGDPRWVDLVERLGFPAPRES